MKVPFSTPAVRSSTVTAKPVNNSYQFQLTSLSGHLKAATAAYKTDPSSLNAQQLKKTSISL
jgi:hypothetical protein